MKWPEYKFTLYKRKYVVRTGELGEKDWFEPYVILDLHINKYSGFHFVCKVPNRSFSSRNPFRCLTEALGALVQRELKLDRRLDE